MESPNRMALDLVDEAIDFADELNVEVHHLDDEAAVLDFGVDASGGVEAGLLATEVATGGLATVQTRLGTVDGAALAHVELTTDHPALAMLGCQSPRWDLDVDGVEAHGSGPARLFHRGGDGVEDVAYADEADFAVLVVESSTLPGEALAEEVAGVANLPTSAVFVLVAPSNSIAGSVSGAARAAERALHRLAMAGIDPTEVLSVTASAPAPPLASSPAEARARSIAAVAGGGRVHLVVEPDVEPLERLRPDTSDGAGHWPAQVTLDVAGGPTQVLGGVDEQQLAADLGL